MPKLLLLGGGLSNSLIAFRLRQCAPDVQVVVVESGDALGGNHTWSFHDADLSAEQRRWMAPLVEHRWSEQSVSFPGYSRKFASPYCAISSSHLDAVIRTSNDAGWRLGTSVRSVQPTGAWTDAGDFIEADAVIDGRGFQAAPMLDIGLQDFVGVEVELAHGHGLDAPVIMDSTVDQADAYCFVYLLPFSPTRVLVEYTRYADTAADRAALQAKALQFVASKGWVVRRIERVEAGCLPIALGGDFDAFWPHDGPAVARAGMRAALFHPTTGYSLPDAVRLADMIATTVTREGRSLDAGSLHDATRRFAKASWDGRGFYRALNRMVFKAARPTERIRIFSRFYGLAPSLIERFYAARSTVPDKLRILTGRPPIPIGRALGAILFA